MLGIVLLAIVPLVALIAGGAVYLREVERARVERHLRVLADTGAADFETRLSSAEQLLRGLAAVPDVREARDPECADLLADVLRRAQRYASLVVVGADGALLCSASPVPSPVNYADRDWFRQASAGTGFGIGKPIFGRVAKEVVIPAYWSLRRADGSLDRIVVTGLRLAWFGELLRHSTRLPGAVTLLWDDMGRVLFREPDAEALTGTTVAADAELFQLAPRHAGTEPLDVHGFDGVRRTYMLTRLDSVEGQGLSFAVGVRREDVDAAANRQLAVSLALASVVCVLVLALTGWVSERQILRPVLRLAQASARQRAGDLSARVAGPMPSGEIGALMTEFNLTAATLEAQSAQLRRTLRAYKVLSECNQALVRARSEKQLLESICELIVRHGGYRFVWVGYAEPGPPPGVRPAAWAGHEEGYLVACGPAQSEGNSARGPIGIALGTGEPVTLADIATDPRATPWRGQALARGYASQTVLPLVADGRPIGALCIYAAEREAFHAEEMPLLRELAGDLAFGIVSLRAGRARDRAETELRASEHKLRLLIEHAPSAIALFDREMRYLACSRRWCEDYRLGDQDLVGRSHVEVFPDLPERWRAIHQRCLAGAVERGDEDEFRRADGTSEWVRWEARPWHEDGGAIGGIVIFSEVVTAYKRAKDEIHALNAGLERRVAERTQQLAEASQAKSEFLANMSHELRTPLNAIIGFSEMLKDGVLGELAPKPHDFVTDIYEAGTHLLALINDILDLSKVESGMLQLQPSAVELTPLFTASTLVVREKALSHRVRLQTELAPGLGSALADERKLKQIAYNLLSNAVKFTPEGGSVTFTVRRCPRAEVRLGGRMPGRLLPLPDGEGDEFVEIAVQDTGAGIAQADLARLFEPFVQIDSSLTRSQPGTGLGLSLVRRLVELHGGAAAVESLPGSGSRFTVWLPYVLASRAEDAPKAHAPPAPSARPRTPLALVIEDDDAVAQTIAEQLRRDRFDVIRAATGEEGLVRAAKSRPDLITLDIFLPEMDGWEFLRRLKGMPAIASTAVVIISVTHDGDRGIALGARRVLHKPFTPDELAEVLAGLAAPSPNGPLVLVVDDNPKAVELAASELQSAGCRVLRAFSGSEAVAAARVARPDLIVLDLMMSGMTGFELARALRDDEATAQTPLIVMTAMDLSADDRAQLDGEVRAIIAKSAFSRGALAVEVRRALARPEPPE